MDYDFRPPTPVGRPRSDAVPGIVPTTSVVRRVPERRTHLGRLTYADYLRNPRTSYDFWRKLMADDLGTSTVVGIGASTDVLLSRQTASAKQPKPDVAPVRTTYVVPTGSPSSPAQDAYRKAYALRLELGDRAYAHWTGRPVKRRKSPVTVSIRRTANDLLGRERPSPGVVVLGTALARDLGIMPVGYLD